MSGREGERRALPDQAIDTARACGAPPRVRLGAFRLFMVTAVVAAVFGFTGIAAGAVRIAKILFFVFLALFVASALFSLVRRPSHGCGPP